MTPVNIYLCGYTGLEGEKIEHVAQPGKSRRGQSQDLYATGGSCWKSVSGLSDAQRISVGKEQKLPQWEEETYEFY